VIVGAMDALVEHHGVARWGCHALGNVAYGRAPNDQQAAALASGALPVVLTAMRVHGDDPRVVEVGTGVQPCCVWSWVVVLLGSLGGGGVAAAADCGVTGVAVVAVVVVSGWWRCC
jgi:hypothetical protein